MNFTPLGIAAGIGLMLVFSAISSFIFGALVHGALARFNGEDPTIRGCLRAATKRFGSLAAFGMFSSIIGYTISSIAERIPFVGGQIVAWMAGSAWNIVSFFAVPVIVSSDKPMSPVAATKRSFALIKQTWGESMILSATIGFVAGISTLIFMAVIFGLFAGFVALNAPVAAINALGVVAAIGLVALIMMFGVLEAFVKAALYHYATTGQSPVTFNSELMKQTFTPKKARKIFNV